LPFPPCTDGNKSKNVFSLHREADGSKKPSGRGGGGHGGDVGEEDVALTDGAAAPWHNQARAAPGSLKTTERWSAALQKLLKSKV